MHIDGCASQKRPHFYTFNNSEIGRMKASQVNMAFRIFLQKIEEYQETTFSVSYFIEYWKSIFFSCYGRVTFLEWTLAYEVLSNKKS